MQDELCSFRRWKSNRIIATSPPSSGVFLTRFDATSHATRFTYRRLKARGETGRVQDMVEKMGGGHRGISIKTSAAEINSPGGMKSRELNHEEEGMEGRGDKEEEVEDKRQSIAVLYEVEGGLGARARTDTGQTEDVITIKHPRGRRASIVMEGSEDENEDYCDERDGGGGD